MLQTEQGRWRAMEQTLVQIRRMWFDAAVEQLPGGCLVLEEEGTLVVLVEGDGPAVDALLAEARRRRAHVVHTPFSRPADLPERLRAAGFRRVQEQGTYIYMGPGHRAVLPPGWPSPRRKTLAALRQWWPALPWQPAWQKAGGSGGAHARARRPLAGRLTVSAVDPAQLPQWNQVFFHAFRPRAMTLESSLAEKERAYQGMGDDGLWYLATLDGRPVGTAILYLGPVMGQVLAVGTLPALRGRGIATAVMQRLLADWQRLGRGSLFLDTLPASGAERLYLRMGFAPAYLRTIYAP